MLSPLLDSVPYRTTQHIVLSVHGVASLVSTRIDCTTVLSCTNSVASFRHLHSTLQMLGSPILPLTVSMSVSYMYCLRALQLDVFTHAQRRHRRRCDLFQRVLRRFRVPCPLQVLQDATRY